MTDTSGPGTDPPTLLIRCELAEAVLLGAAMLAPQQAATIVGGLSEDDFATGKHQAIYAAIDRLVQAGTPPDPVTVLGELRAHGQVPMRNGADVGVFLLDLMERVPTVAGAGHWRQIILEHAFRRRAAQAADRIGQHAADAPLTDLTDLIGREHHAITHAARRAGLPDSQTGIDIAAQQAPEAAQGPRRAV